MGYICKYLNYLGYKCNFPFKKRLWQQNCNTFIQKSLSPILGAQYNVNTKDEYHETHESSEKNVYYGTFVNIRIHQFPKAFLANLPKSKVIHPTEIYQCYLTTEGDSNAHTHRYSCLLERARRHDEVDWNESAIECEHRLHR